MRHHRLRLLEICLMRMIPRNRSLGRFTAAAATKQSIFIDRTSIPADPIEEERTRILETCELVCPTADQISCEPVEGGICPVITFTVCEEGRFTTQLEPDGWIEQDN